MILAEIFIHVKTDDISVKVLKFFIILCYSVNSIVELLHHIKQLTINLPNKAHSWLSFRMEHIMSSIFGLAAGRPKS